MIRISQLKLPVEHTPDELLLRAARMLRIKEHQIKELNIRKKSLDARKKPLQYVYTVDVSVSKEETLVRRVRSNQVALAKETAYCFPEEGTQKLQKRPVIVGTGPAGLFCALMLAQAGYRPIVLERGQQARERKQSVETFWREGNNSLRLDSNVQFGEGGAGTFSDGKLNTLVKDPKGRGQKVLELFVEAGAPERILYDSKPHLGTDVLVEIVEHMRREIEALGGQVLFGQQLVEIYEEKGRVRGVGIRPVQDKGQKESQKRNRDNIRQEDEKNQGTDHKEQRTDKETWTLETEVLVLAIGHSARDTFAMLQRMGIPMEQKAFAVGVRIEHPQNMINQSQYGADYPRGLEAAAYKVTQKTASGRGVYSFCMCPGGYVVNASSERERLAINGMSYQARDGKNANSAMIVTVGPGDFRIPEGFAGPLALAGMEFQRRLEERAFLAGQGKVPVQLLGDFLKNQTSRTLGDIEPCIKGAWEFGDVRGIFSRELSDALAEGITGCGRWIAGFDRPDAVLSGVESRTSSPVRILRSDCLESTLKGLYPCGEGAGYAGGITSAAMDGIRVAEEIRKRYRARG